MGTFGEALYEAGYRNSIARYRVGGIQTRRFNPSVPLASPYAIGKDGRAYQNPEWPISVKGRYDFLLDEISGFAGERVPDKATEIIPFAKKLVGESWQPFDIGMSDNWHPIDEAWYDLAYVSNGLLMAVQGLMLAPKPGSALDNAAEFVQKIKELEQQIASKDRVINNIIDDIEAIDFPARGGGRYVTKLKSVLSALESLL